MAHAQRLHGSWFSRLLNGLGKEQSNNVLTQKQSGLFPESFFQTYLQSPGKAAWMPREYLRFSDEAYIKNVVAYRSIHMIASSAASIEWKLMNVLPSGARKILVQHPLLKLLKNPNPIQGGSEFFESVISYRLISGNSYIQRSGSDGGQPKELYTMRPDRMSIIAGRSSIPKAYRYTIYQQDGQELKVDFPVHPITGACSILHLKTFHPLDDWYGLSPIEAAAYSIDQHNQSGAWNQALLQNGARPSGALVVKSDNGNTLSEEQYQRLKLQISEEFSGPDNAGKPILLEGGLEWREMSLTPKDMDYLNAKHSSARDIALAFGVPPQLLGIPGDNTYSNLAEARLALWEETILPLIDQLCDALNNWLVPHFGNSLQLTYDTHSISALSLRREQIWDRVNKSDFMTDDEKRMMVGLPPLKRS
jgi:HK97 family phage portal protein